MPTKFPRRRCILCSCRHVSWKMPSLANAFGENRIFVCWSCAALVHAKLDTFDLSKPPNKHQLLSRAFKIPAKKKQETW